MTGAPLVAEAPAKAVKRVTGVMKVMGRMGDQTIGWDADDEKQVMKARTRFAQLVSQGHRAFLMDETGKKGKQITEFEPSAGSILMVPAIAGG